MLFSEFQLCWQRFQKPLSDLSFDQQQQLKTLAYNKEHLEKQILASTEARHVTYDTEHYHNTIHQMREQFADDASFEQALEQADLSYDSWCQGIARALHVEAILDYVTRDCFVTEAELLQYYHRHPQQFAHEEKRLARHILLTVNEQFAENQPDAMQRRIHHIANEINNVDDFKQLAMRHSECPTALNGGELGWVKKGVLFNALETTLFAMTPGQLSQPVISELGWHLLWCDSIHPAGLADYEDIKDSLQEQLLEHRRQRQQKRWIASLQHHEVPPS